MPTRELPARPNLEHLKNQARKLLKQALALDAEAAARFAAAGVSSSAPKLADALHVIAREHGFDTWPALKLHVNVGSEDPAEALAAAIQANDAKVVREVLGRHSSLREHIDEPLAGLSFDTPALSAQRCGTMPGPWNCFWSRVGPRRRCWTTDRLRCTMRRGMETLAWFARFWGMARR